MHLTTQERNFLKRLHKLSLKWTWGVFETLGAWTVYKPESFFISTHQTVEQQQTSSLTELLNFNSFIVLIHLMFFFFCMIRLKGWQCKSQCCSHIFWLPVHLYSIPPIFPNSILAMEFVFLKRKSQQCFTLIFLPFKKFLKGTCYFLLLTKDNKLIICCSLSSSLFRDHF